MNLYEDYIKFNLAKVIGIVFIAVCITAIIWNFNTKDPQWSGLVAGLASGFAVATIQYFLSWYDYVKIDKYEKLKIKDIRPDRDNRQLYESLIKKAKNEIIILGATANRLINDFANESSNNDNNKVLIFALSRGVKVKILLPNIDFLEDNQKAHFQATKTRFEEINSQYGLNLPR